MIHGPGRKSDIAGVAGITGRSGGNVTHVLAGSAGAVMTGRAGSGGNSCMRKDSWRPRRCIVATVALGCRYQMGRWLG